MRAEFDQSGVIGAALWAFVVGLAGYAIGQTLTLVVTDMRGQRMVIAASNTGSL